MKYCPERDIWYEEGEQIYETLTVVRADGTIRYQITRLDGLKQALPNGEASEVSYDTSGRPFRKVWHEENREHRIGEASRIVFHNGTDQRMTEGFSVNGQPISKEDGPCRRRWNLDGSLWKEEFHEDEERTTEARPPPSLDP